VRFVTPIYHPNIDSGGRICLDVLKMPPQGGWKPSQNLSTVLTSIYLLMAEPNPDDGLMPDITKEYRENRALFLEKANASTKSHAASKVAVAAVPRETKEAAAGVRPGEESSSDDYDSDEKENDAGRPEAKRPKTEGAAGAAVE